MSKIIITSNPLNHEGGVANYYRIFFRWFKDKKIQLLHLSVGSRMEYFYAPWKKRLLYPFYYCLDMYKLFKLLWGDSQVHIVQVSPSLIPIPLIRDAFILLGAKIMGRRTIVFFHGWKENVVSFLQANFLVLYLFRLIYGRADMSIVLATRFKNDLISMGWDADSIEVTTTMYEGDSILPFEDRSGKRIRFLYLGRISQLKGIDELIEAAKILLEKGYDYEFMMVGHGDRDSVVEGYQKLVRANGLNDFFCFTGRLTGEKKFRVFAESDVYVFPSWSEGCPTSVLEALGAGLFVVSTNVGALADIIDSRKNGRIVRRKDPDDLADALVWVCENIELIRNKRSQIMMDAKARYETDAVVKQVKRIYARLVDE